MAKRSTDSRDNVSLSRLSPKRKVLAELLARTFVWLGSTDAMLRGATPARSVFNFTIAAVVLGAGVIDLYWIRIDRSV